MRIFRDAAVVAQAADPQTFTGPASTKLLGSAEEGTPVHVYRVVFREGARTHWHYHSGPQWLFVVEGTVRIQRWGEPAVDVAAGDAINIPPGEKHWHGAAPGARGVHLAVNVDAKTTWLEAVTDDEFGGSAAK